MTTNDELTNLRKKVKELKAENKLLQQNLSRRDTDVWEEAEKRMVKGVGLDCSSLKEASEAVRTVVDQRDKAEKEVKALKKRLDAWKTGLVQEALSWVVMPKQYRFIRIGSEGGMFEVEVGFDTPSGLVFLGRGKDEDVVIAIEKAFEDYKDSVL